MTLYVGIIRGSGTVRNTGLREEEIGSRPIKGSGLREEILLGGTFYTESICLVEKELRKKNDIYDDDLFSESLCFTDRSSLLS